MLCLASHWLDSENFIFKNSLLDLDSLSLNSRIKKKTNFLVDSESIVCNQALLRIGYVDKQKSLVFFKRGFIFSMKTFFIDSGRTNRLDGLKKGLGGNLGNCKRMN